MKFAFTAEVAEDETKGIKIIHRGPLGSMQKLAVETGTASIVECPGREGSIVWAIICTMQDGSLHSIQHCHSHDEAKEILGNMG